MKYFKQVYYQIPLIILLIQIQIISFVYYEFNKKLYYNNVIIINNDGIEIEQFKNVNVIESYYLDNKIVLLQRHDSIIKMFKKDTITYINFKN